MLDWLFFPASSYVISQWLFLKLMALNYLFAFWSLFIQVKGLYGEKGITPIHELVGEIAQMTRRKPYIQFPSIFWWKSTDSVIQGAAVVGLGASFLALLGIPYIPLWFFLAWAIYLSFETMGSVFLSFQWDTLLLEMGFITIFFSVQSPPLFIYILLLWFLLFRFMFASGIVKWMASTPEWRNFTAMSYHYETQPLPTRLAYYAHLLPKKIAKLSVLLTLFIEIVVPFFIFTTDEIRLIVFTLLVGLQVLIALTGNYAFFNTLSITLCIPLLSDHYLSWLPISATGPLPLFVQTILFLVAIGLFFLNVGLLLSLFMEIPLFYRIFRGINSYNLVNSYGLFANMTTKRPEIIVEGSEDGVHWLPYEFKWKPGDLTKLPKLVAPHQPRLDWQMWFAALGHYRQNPWFVNFLGRLLQGSTSVLKLLKTNPFPDHPPKFIRASFYDYHFSDRKTKKETGQWWTRTYKGIYLPPITLHKENQNKKE